MKTVSAKLGVEVLVDCPHCDQLIDLLKDEDTNGVLHDDECAVLKQALPDGDWHEAHRKFTVNNVTCTECKKSFNVKDLEW